METGIYYIVISDPNFYYKDIFEISNLYEYYELKEDQIIFTNWTEKNYNTKSFLFSLPKLSKSKYIHIFVNFL